MTTLTTEHPTAESHQHTHGPDCGHDAVIHLDHGDHLHDGHAHREHDGHHGHHDVCATCSCVSCADTCAA